MHALATGDGETLDATHLPARDGGGGLAVVLAHGFTGSWRNPHVREIAERLSAYAGVLAFDFRGHGGSTGLSTLGDKEILDVEAAVVEARRLGYARVVTCGWSMGGSAVLRHAALFGDVDAVVSVSAPSRWYVKDTAPMRRLHWVVENRLGRLVARRFRGTRIASTGWDPVPESPLEVVGRIAPIPLLLVHGDCDPYFHVYHAHDLAEAAGEPSELWLVPGFGHAEAAAAGQRPELVDRIGRHLADLVAEGEPRS